jgi:hypothetical protein
VNCGRHDERAQERCREQPCCDREVVLAGELLRKQRRGDREDPGAHDGREPVRPDVREGV